MRGRTPVFLAGMVAFAAACSSADAGVTTSTSDSGDQVATTTDGSDRERSDEAGITGDEPSPPPSTATVEPVAVFEPAPIEWEQFDDEVDVATLAVPVDYADPNGAVFDLALARYNAIDTENRIGTLLLNRGGPGFAGAEFAKRSSFIFDQPLLERFDIVGWDPRGVGESTPAIDCISEYDPYFNELDSTPETDEERELLVETAKRFADECTRLNGDILPHIGTNNAARDMDTIRRALGEDTVSYYGFSYGSELGGVWATLFPDTVRAAVFDGASDPAADPLEASLQQIAGFEASLTTFLARCSADDACAFHNDGDAEGAFDALLADIDENPIPSADGRPPVNREVATTAVQQAMYLEAYWPALELSLTAAQDGDGSGLLALNDNYYRRGPDGTYGNELEAFRAITCADTATRKTVAEADAETELYSEVSPRLWPEDSAGGYSCTFFAPAIDPRIEITGAGAGPIVVIGTTGDPATPFESTVRMAETLEDGRLVVVEADQHTGYGVNRCVVDVVNDYLIDLEAPDDGTECR
ncbi:alpha/beta hydrolase [Ilumatobacter sp.]|uniref:alpha/beta hydrolase n=1 Tax=Ilumatobacter sp. TaxID=1967498 RepID=UPI003AF5D16E